MSTTETTQAENEKAAANLLTEFAVYTSKFGITDSRELKELAKETIARKLSGPGNGAAYDAPWRKRYVFHGEGALVTLATFIAAGALVTVGTAAYNRRAGKADATHENPFASTDSVEASSRPSTLKAAK